MTRSRFRIVSSATHRLQRDVRRRDTFEEFSEHTSADVYPELCATDEMKVLNHLVASQDIGTHDRDCRCIFSDDLIRRTLDTAVEARYATSPGEA